MYRYMVLFALCGAAFISSGCTAVAGQALKEARGARGTPILLRAAPTAVRGQSLQFTPAGTSLGPQVAPPAVLAAWDRAAGQLAARLVKEYPGGEPVLTLDADVLYFQGKGVSSGGLLLVHVLTRIGNEPAGDVLLRAESESFRAGNEDALSRAAVDALGKYLRERGPAGG